MNAIQYEAPGSVEDAVALLAQANGEARVLAGGTDLLVQMRAGHVRPGLIVDVKNIFDMTVIAPDDGGFRIGAATCGSRIDANNALKADWPGVVEAVELIGSTQIQGRASIGGNLCNASPAADGIPALLCLDAEVELSWTDGVARMPLGDFITGNRRTARRADQLMTAALVPKSGAARAASRFLKLGAREYLVISIAMVAVCVESEGDGFVSRARVALGACSEVAQRLEALEATLAGRPLDARLGEAVEPAHLAELSPIDDMRATAAYRRDAALTLVRRALSELGAAP